MFMISEISSCMLIVIGPEKDPMLTHLKHLMLCCSPSED